MDSNLIVNLKTKNTEILNNTPQTENQAKESVLKSRAAKIGLGILGAAIPLACAAIYYHKYSAIHDDATSLYESQGAPSPTKKQETLKNIPFDVRDSQRLSPTQMFTRLCLVKDEPGCLSFAQNQFPQMVKNAFATHAVYLLKRCKEKQTESCQSVIQQAFPKLIETDIDQAIDYAKICVKHKDQACLDVVDTTYQALLIKDKSKALNFANYCFKNDHEPFMSKAEKSLPALLEGVELQALNCAINDTAECSVDVPATFDKLLNTSSLLASLFAKVCINKKEPVYQSVIDMALPGIIEKDLSHAVVFANSCLESNSGCAQIIQKHLPLLFSDPINLITLGNKQMPCFGKKIPACKDFIKNSYFQLKNDPLFPLFFLSQSLFNGCVGKEDPDCQAVVLDMIENESNIPHVNIDKCMDKEDAVCQLVVQKAFDYHKKGNGLHSHRIAVRCIQKKSSACENVIKNSFEVLEASDVQHSFARQCIEQKDPRFVSEAFKKMLKNEEYYVDEYTKMCKGKSDEACLAVMKVMPAQVEYDLFKEKLSTFFNSLIEDIKDFPKKRLFNP